MNKRREGGREGKGLELCHCFQDSMENATFVPSARLNNGRFGFSYNFRFINLSQAGEHDRCGSHAEKLQAVETIRASSNVEATSSIRYTGNRSNGIIDRDRRKLSE